MTVVPFWLGVITTLGAEFILIVFMAAFRAVKGGKK